MEKTKMYRVKIKGFADEVYHADIDTILGIIKTFADVKDIISIIKITKNEEN